MLELLENRLAPAAIIWTDRSDYLPQSTATIFGSGFLPGETVQLQVLHTTGDPASFANDDPWLVTDGTNGGFQTTWFVANDCVGATLLVTATGLTSGETAQTTFTDSVQRASTTTVVTSSPNPLVFGQTSLTFTAAVTRAFDNGGDVQFAVDGLNYGPNVPVSGGCASIGDGRPFASAIIGLSGGTHTITASYSGDWNFYSSSSGTVTQTVTPVNSTTVVTSSPESSVFGQSVRFTASVSPQWFYPTGASYYQTGTMTFLDGGVPLGTVTLASWYSSPGNTIGTAWFTTSNLAVATHTITAIYGGDTNFTGSTSGNFLQTVTDNLVVTAQPPSNVLAGKPFDVQISVKDANGNVDPNFNGNVTIAMANNPGGSTLGGTLTVAADAGVADFNDLTLDSPGTGYTLQASGNYTGSATTNPFDVTDNLVVTTQPPSEVVTGTPSR